MKHILKFYTFSLASILFSCAPEGPQPVNFGKDQCDNCQMTITDNKFAAELITEKGKVYKFDDIVCLKDYQTQNSDKTVNAKLYVSDFQKKILIPLEKATFIKGGEITSPMSGNTAAFQDKTKALEEAKKMGATEVKY